MLRLIDRRSSARIMTPRNMACSKDMPDLDYTPSNAEIQRLPEAGGWNDLLDADATSRTIP